MANSAVLKASTFETAARKRGRPHAESPHEKLARLETELASARAQVREAEQRKFVIVGEAVAAEAAASGEFRATLAEILTRRVTSGAAKADISALLAGAH